MIECPMCLEKVDGLIEYNGEKICVECANYRYEEDEMQAYLKDEEAKYLAGP